MAEDVDVAGLAVAGYQLALGLAVKLRTKDILDASELQQLVIVAMNGLKLLNLPKPLEMAAMKSIWVVLPPEVRAHFGPDRA